MPQEDTTYSLLDVALCLGVNDFEMVNENPMKDYYVYRKPSYEQPVLLPKGDSMSDGRVREIAHQASIPQQKFMEDLRIIGRIREQKRIDSP